MPRMHLPERWLKFLSGPKDKKTSEPHDLKAKDNSGCFDEVVVNPLVCPLKLHLLFTEF